MILSTPEELRLYLPTHVLDNIDNVRGGLDNSENDFLRERVGAPLLARLSTQYATDYIVDGNPDLEAIDRDILNPPTKPWPMLIALCQRCIVYDAFGRLADIQPVSVHDAGINVVETKGYDNAPDKTLANYKAQLIRESHAAVNRLLIQLEEWQAADAKRDQQQQLSEDEQSIHEIIDLWKQSSYYYYVDGMLFNTATDFGRFVNIYDSREKFIQLVPDIRYCQETHIEAEIGEDLLADLIAKRKADNLNPEEAKAFAKLQRVLSLQVEARSSLFKRPAAADEAQGQLHLVLDRMRRNQTQFNKEAVQTSPIFDPKMWEPNQQPTTNPLPSRPHTCECDHHKHDGGMLISSII